MQLIPGDIKIIDDKEYQLNYILIDEHGRTFVFTRGNEVVKIEVR